MVALERRDVTLETIMLGAQTGEMHGAKIAADIAIQMACGGESGEGLGGVGGGRSSWS